MSGIQRSRGFRANSGNERPHAPHGTWKLVKVGLQQVSAAGHGCRLAAPVRQVASAVRILTLRLRREGTKFRYLPR
jgi:hypothetical protein